MTELRKRMLEDLKLAGLAPKSYRTYIGAQTSDGALPKMSPYTRAENSRTKIAPEYRSVMTNNRNRVSAPASYIVASRKSTCVFPAGCGNGRNNT